MKLKNILIFVILYFFFSSFLLIIFIYNQTKTHEKVHELIAINHGCLNTTTNIYWFGLKGGELICNQKTENISLQYELQERKLHGLHEIVSYNIQTTNLLILMAILITILLFFLYNFFGGK